MPRHSGKWVSYLRVSTDRQGQSGLGLEAQRKAVLDFLNGGNWKLAEEFVEVESGKRNNRPQLAAALAACKRLKARLVVAKLDRLARNVAFISKLMERRRVYRRRHAIRQQAHYPHSGGGGRTRTRSYQRAHQGGARCRKGERRQARWPEAKTSAAARRGLQQSQCRSVCRQLLPIIQQIKASGATSLRAIAKAMPGA